jgi:hypothetical protein
MSDRRKLSRIAIAAVLAFAVAAPTAAAMPLQEARQKDMHASTVQITKTQSGDLRGENAKSPTDTAPPAQPPVFPHYHTPLALPQPQTVAADDGTDVDWPIIGIAFGATLLLGGLGLAAYRSKSRQPRAAH